jgi:hypothetical protein
MSAYNYVIAYKKNAYLIPQQFNGINFLYVKIYTYEPRRQLQSHRWCVKRTKCASSRLECCYKHLGLSRTLCTFNRIWICFILLIWQKGSHETCFSNSGNIYVYSELFTCTWMKYIKRGFVEREKNFCHFSPKTTLRQHTKKPLPHFYFLLCLYIWIVLSFSYVPDCWFLLLYFGWNASCSIRAVQWSVSCNGKGPSTRFVAMCADLTFHSECMPWPWSAL